MFCRVERHIDSADFCDVHRWLLCGSANAADRHTSCISGIRHCSVPFGCVETASLMMAPPAFLNANVVSSLMRAADIISAVEFDGSGKHLATGDRGGRVVLFDRIESQPVGYPATALPFTAPDEAQHFPGSPMGSSSCIAQTRYILSVMLRTLRRNQIYAEALGLPVLQQRIGPEQRSPPQRLSQFEYR